MRRCSREEHRAYASQHKIGHTVAGCHTAESEIGDGLIAQTVVPAVTDIHAERPLVRSSNETHVIIEAESVAQVFLAGEETTTQRESAIDTETLDSGEERVAIHFDTGVAPVEKL